MRRSSGVGRPASGSSPLPAALGARASPARPHSPCPAPPAAPRRRMAPRSLSRLKSVDFYKKIPTDLTEATLTGAWLSIAASVIMSLLLVLVGVDLMSARRV